MSYFDDVKAFHDKFGLSYDGVPRELPADELLFRMRFLEEETKEAVEAMSDGLLSDTAGELCDVIWIACGIAHRMGIDLDRHWEAVRKANMAKVRASNSEQSKRGSTLDIVKPEGWKRADHSAIVAATTASKENCNGLKK